MAALDQLPIEVYQMIFEYLDLIEISNCRLVSKKLNEFVKTFRVRELSFYDSDWDRRHFWFYDGNPIYPCNSLSGSKVSILNSTSIDLQYLKRLRFGIVEDEFDLEVVNKFENLVHLELDFEYNAGGWSEESEIKKLKLNSLKHLFLHFESPIFIKFDTPKLDSFVLDYKGDEVDQLTETIQFATPCNVKELYTFGLLLNELPKDFGGLKHLQCDRLMDLDLDYILKTFPDLEVLEILLDKERFEEDYNDALAQILREKARLRPSLKVCFEGFLLSDSKVIESYAKKSQLTLMIKHYSSLVDTNNLLELDYNELMSFTKNGYPIGFLDLQPFTRICSVFVNDMIDDSNCLLNFLLNCINLCHLQLTNCSLGIEFFDQLPSFTSLLQLEIYAEDRVLQLDFNRFLFKITNLVQLKTDQNMKADLLRDLLQKLKFVCDFDFKVNGQRFWIYRPHRGEYELRCYDKDVTLKVINNLTCENLIKQLNEWVDEPINDFTPKAL